MSFITTINNSLKRFVTRKSKVLLQTQDVDLLERFGKVAASFGSLKIGRSHQLYNTAADAKNVIVEDGVTSSAVHNVNVVTLFFNKSIAGLPSGEANEISIRLYLARNYFERLKQTIKDNDISVDLLSSKNMKRLVDVFVLGTSSERIEEHIRLYGASLTQAKLQDCFYSLLEPEIEACSSLLLMQPHLHKDHKKKIPAYAKSYLLDKAEVNMKTRCVLAWSDPTFTGFKPHPDDYAAPLEDLLKSRNLYFKECTNMGKQFVNDVISDRKQLYDDKLETRVTMAKGTIFFIVICLMDWGVCSL